MRRSGDRLTSKPDWPGAFKDLLIYKWLLSAVAAALLSKGFCARGVLTLQGPQGIGKTTWVRSLVPDALLSAEVVRLDHHLDGSNKDSILIAISHWLVEIGELESSFKRDVARLKGFLTLDRDKVRRPYAKEATEYPRRTVFAASVNSHDFLLDSTGNSRFWTLPVIEVDHQHGIDMQQVFAQLAVDLENGEEWWLTPDEETMLEYRNQRHRAVGVQTCYMCELYCAQGAIYVAPDQFAVERVDREAVLASEQLGQVRRDHGWDRPTQSDHLDHYRLLARCSRKALRQRSGAIRLDRDSAVRAAGPSGL